MRSPYSKPRGKLPTRQKAILAAMTLLDVVQGKIEDKEVGPYLRRELGLQWTFLTCLQYLSGREAFQALSALPDDWAQNTRSKADAISAVALAAHAVANARPDGVMLCDSHLAAQFKGVNRDATGPD
jgi:hypothetical protein